MTDSPGSYEFLTFNSPLSQARAEALVTRLAAAQPRTVLDLGCGWGELVLRLGAALPAAGLRGVDTDERLLDRARRNARERGLDATFDAVPAAEVTEPADLVLCIGSSHALGESVPQALAALWRLVSPGGRLVYGEGTWEERGPVDHTLVWDDMYALPSVAGLVDRAVETGFRPLWVETASTDELYAFESGYLADSEEWLLTHPDETRQAANDEHRTRWLHGYRNGFGFAYLTLGRPGGR
jgi:cyclopropane fatty-acyl-phospholipid synthase-like methyltransferase